MNLRALLFGVAIVLIGTVGVVLWLYAPGGNRIATDNSAVPIGGPFELVSETGEVMTDADFNGRYMLLYFGYTYCPDICPTGLATMMAAYEQLPTEIRAQIEPVFITVDPERDTVEVVADYTDLFHDELIGLTGSVDAVEDAKSTFRVYAKKVDDDSAAEYLVDHSTFTYLIGADGHYVTHFRHGETPDAIAAKVLEETS